MQPIINKAIEGGYSWSGTKGQAEMLLDPLFWQALGKACGWKKVHDDPKLCGRVFPDWKDNALRFHETNLTQGFDKAIEFLQEATNTK